MVYMKYCNEVIVLYHCPALTIITDVKIKSVDCVWNIYAKLANNHSDNVNI